MQPSDTLKTTVISFEADRRDALDTQKKHIRKRAATPIKPIRLTAESLTQ